MSMRFTKWDVTRTPSLPKISSEGVLDFFGVQTPHMVFGSLGKYDEVYASSLKLDSWFRRLKQKLSNILCEKMSKGGDAAIAGRATRCPLPVTGGGITCNL